MVPQLKEQHSKFLPKTLVNRHKDNRFENRLSSGKESEVDIV